MPTLRPQRDVSAELVTLATAAIPSDEERVAVADVSALRAGDFIRVDGEVMWVRSATASPLTVARGFAGTVAVAHAAGASVWRVPVAIPEHADAPPKAEPLDDEEDEG